LHEMGVRCPQIPECHQQEGNGYTTAFVEGIPCNQTNVKNLMVHLKGVSNSWVISFSGYSLA